mgnify:CR=1 FL=1
MKEDKIGYISVQGFEDCDLRTVQVALEDLEAQGWKDLLSIFGIIREETWILL